ncbi:cell cycle control CWC2-related protein [Cryptosporidium ubiquitum]|uniref:Cell cycle control CWC2-related protein n=1 Tax=Cryptosporidium ubiquitum TaxID=857276 RepID=A0A1J4MIV8_9CRYT|nr:cell cycle control CWC2-related protein [Cryptosporidium ubiquitum]OII73395.1 cell cycle control CWC2-related protein [Cryptosporidium ubiquitum]
MDKVPVEFKRKPTVEELKRPARAQSDGSLQSNLAYKEGGELYNIWYGKYQFDYDKRGKLASKTKCVPEKDSGWTKADQDPSTKSHFCLYFAKGACVNGSKCKYFHRIPTEEDDALVSPMYDVFGRERHAQHKDDMTGTGSFNKECRTIFVGDLYINRSKTNYLEGVNKVIKREFSVWGPVDYIRVIPSKNIAFIRYFLRSSAEFAKAAMENQIIFKGQTEPITVRWAYDDPNPTSMENSKKRNAEEVEKMVSNLETEKKSKPDLQVNNEIEGFFCHLNNLNYNVPSEEVVKIQKDYYRVEKILESIKTSKAKNSGKSVTSCEESNNEEKEPNKQEDNSIYDVVL